MAGIKISALPSIPSSQLTDLGPFVQGGVTYKATLSQILTLFNSNIQLASVNQVTGLPAALASFLPLSGGTMSGIINMGNNIISNLPAPVNGGDAVNKTYADAIASGITVILASEAATTVNLNATPAGAGVGATLTNAGAMAAFAVDGYSASLNDRILVKNQTLTQHNGVYTVTTLGSGAVNWVLTRATDYDSNTEIVPGTLVGVNNGTVNAGTSWLETATVTVVDTDPVLFTQFTFGPGSFLLKANNLSDVANMTTSFDNISPLTTIGDLIGFDGANNIRVAVGITDGDVLQVDSGAAAGFSWGAPASMQSPFIANGRMTLSTGVPVTTSDVLAATIVYFTPYKGNQISLFDGASTWTALSFSEANIAVPASASTMYDLFAYNNSGTIALETQVWTNDTTRAVALVVQDGIYVKSGATTRRYLGSFRTTNVAGQCEDSAKKRYVWNYANRVKRNMFVGESAANWNYSTATFRQANANPANQLDLVIGVSEDSVNASVITMTSTSTAAFRATYVGVGLDSTTIDSAQVTIQGQANVSTENGFPQARFDQAIPVGRHTLVWLEMGAGANTQTWYGDAPVPFQSGITGDVWA